jgi:hypothetical protein
MKRDSRLRRCMTRLFTVGCILAVVPQESALAQWDVTWFRGTWTMSYGNGSVNADSNSSRPPVTI